MLFERMLAKLISSTHLPPKSEQTVQHDVERGAANINDSDTSEDNSPRSSTPEAGPSNIKSSSAGSKRTRDSEPAVDDHDCVSESPPTKKAKQTSTPTSEHTVRFHPSTVDNWRWADRDLQHQMKIRRRHPTPSKPDSAASHSRSTSDSPSILHGPQLPSSPSPPAPATDPVIPPPSRLSSANLTAFLESDPENQGPLRNCPTLSPSAAVSVRAVHNSASRAPSLIANEDAPSRSPSPELRRMATGNGMWPLDDETEERLKATEEDRKRAAEEEKAKNIQEEEILRRTLATSATPLNQAPTSAIPANQPILSAAEVAHCHQVLRKLPSEVQATVEKLSHHRCQKAWEHGFQAGIHTQLTQHALAAAVENADRLLRGGVDKVVNGKKRKRDVLPVPNPVKIIPIRTAKQRARDAAKCEVQGLRFSEGIPEESKFDVEHRTRRKP